MMGFLATIILAFDIDLDGFLVLKIMPIIEDVKGCFILRF